MQVMVLGYIQHPTTSTISQSAVASDSYPQSWHIGDSTILRDYSFDYLGVKFKAGDDLFDTHVATLPPRANHALEPYLHSASVLHRAAPPRIAKMVLMAHGLPHLEYGLQASHVSCWYG